MKLKPFQLLITGTRLSLGGSHSLFGPHASRRRTHRVTCTVLSAALSAERRLTVQHFQHHSTYRQPHFLQHWRDRLSSVIQRTFASQKFCGTWLRGAPSGSARCRRHARPSICIYVSYAVTSHVFGRREAVCHSLGKQTSRRIVRGCT